MIFRILKDFVYLFFPNVCLGCGNGLAKEEGVICTFCEFNLPQTGFHLEENNIVEKHFWGRIKINHATAMYYFDKATRVQRLIHQLKYQGRKEVGNKLGVIYGNYLKESLFYKDVDMIIPVPLHRNKKHTRTYNQSDTFAEGLSKSMGIPWDGNILSRVKYTESQTRKTRLERWENVSTAFHLNDPEEIQDKHILLVDDVITTGATLEACAHVLFQARNVRVSIATIAVAQH